MTPFSLRPPGRDDAEAIVALVCACDVEELGAPDYDLESLLAEWREPGVVAGRDGRVAAAPDGELLGYALLTGDDVRAWTHPERRGLGVGSALLAFAHERGTGRELRQQVSAGNLAAGELLRRAGYAVRAHHRQMRLRLAEEHAAPGGAPAGIVLRPFRPGEEDRIAHALLQAALADVPGQPPKAFDAWRADGGPGGPHFDAGLWRVAEDAATGAPVGVLAAEAREGAGHVLEVGVPGAQRGRGIGAALLRDAFATFASRGLDEATLTVRTANANALRLYEHLGMEPGWAVDELVRPR